MNRFSLSLSVVCVASCTIALLAAMASSDGSPAFRTVAVASADPGGTPGGPAPCSRIAVRGGATAIRAVALAVLRRAVTKLWKGPVAKIHGVARTRAPPSATT